MTPLIVLFIGIEVVVVTIIGGVLAYQRQQMKIKQLMTESEAAMLKTELAKTQQAVLRIANQLKAVAEAAGQRNFAAQMSQGQ